MSWSFSAGPSKLVDLRRDLSIAAEQPWQYVSNDPETQTEVKQQINAAIDAAVALVASGAFGDVRAKLFGASLSGHGNPGHELRYGWANDSVYISVYQANAPANE